MSDLPVLPAAPEQGFGEFKEKRSTWKRWEMTPIANDLAAQGRTAYSRAQSSQQARASAVSIEQAALVQQRLEEQAAIERKGYQEGFARGQSEGYAAGMATAQERAALHLRALALDWGAALRQADAQVADDLLALALDLARQVVGQALKVEPQTMLAVVHQLLQSEPALTGAPQLFLHPDDAALVKEHLTDDLHAAGWRIRLDPQLTRGGCRVLAHSGERDARMETRWERVAAALARSPSPTAGTDHE